MKSLFENHPLHYSIYTRACANDVFDMLSMDDGLRLLDIGCGIGYFLENVYCQNHFIHIHGIEYDLDSIRYISKRIEGNFINGDATQLPYPDDTFDRIISVSVLEHLQHEDNMLKESVRVSRNGAEIIISVPSKEGIRSNSRLRNLGHTDPQNKEYHYRIGYTQEELVLLLSRNGILVEEIRYSLLLISEIIMDLVKGVFFIFNKLNSQSNITKADSSYLFKIYRFCFPFILSIETFEKFLLGRWLKGHILTVRGKVFKD